MSRDKDNKMDVYTGGRLTKGVIETIAPHLKDTTLDGRFNAKANATSLAAKLDKTEAADLYPTKADVSATYALGGGSARTITGPTLPTLPSGTEYIWNKTDGAGTLLDIVSGVA